MHTSQGMHFSDAVPKNVPKPTTSGPLLLLLNLLLQQHPHRFTDKQTPVFAHGSDCLVIGRVEPDADGRLAQWFITVRYGELMGLQVLGGAHL